MKNKNLNKIYEEFLTRYKKENLPVRKRKLQEFISRAEKQAKDNYKKLKEPKTCSLATHTQVRVWDVVSYDFATKAVKTIKMDSPPDYIKDSVAFYLLLGEDKLRNIRKKLYDTPQNNRKEIWKTFNLPLEKIERALKKMVKERNVNAKDKGFDGQLGLALDWHKIPTAEYQNFIENKDKVIDFCNKQLSDFTDLPDWFYSEFNRPCFLCQLPSIPFKTQDEIFEFVAKKYKILSKYKDKIDIKEGRKSKMSYKGKTDNFLITINENVNSRHRLMDLLHELAHVIDYLNTLGNDSNPFEKGTYLREKNAAAIEIKLLKEISPRIYKAHFGDVLLNFWETLFTVGLYTDPDQDLSKLYASIFNKCFKKASQTNNPTYILNENIVLKPFTVLPHTVAVSQTL